MPSDRLVVEFEREADGKVALHVSGRLDQATVPLLDGVLRALRTLEADVIVDLAGVAHIDTEGLELLFAAEAPSDASNASVQVIGVRESLGGGWAAG